MENENDFARLERHDGLQVLCMMRNDDNKTGTMGPCVVTRVDIGVTIETMHGPWTDDEEGWTAAEQFMVKMDLSEFVARAVEMVNKVINDIAKPDGEPH